MTDTNMKRKGEGTTKTRLFLFPFAGGSKYSFAQWEKGFPAHVEVFPLELPGRGGRFGSPLLNKMEDVVKDYLLQLEGNMNGPFAFFGHSMGSYAAYMATLQLSRQNRPLPRHLFLSGRAGLNPVPDYVPLYNLPREEFWTKISEFGGLPPELSEYDELKDFLEPIIRADFEAIESVKRFEPVKLDAPITLLQGETDRSRRETQAEWDAMCAFPINEVSFPGGHFFINEELAKIQALIAETLLQ